MISEAFRPQSDASRKGNFVYIVPLDPTYLPTAGKAAAAGHAPATAKEQRMANKIVLLIRT